MVQLCLAALRGGDMFLGNSVSSVGHRFYPGYGTTPLAHHCDKGKIFAINGPRAVSWSAGPSKIGNTRRGLNVHNSA